MKHATPGARDAAAPVAAAAARRKHAELTVHRAEVLRELDAALRAQWPQSFQKAVQVCDCEVFQAPRAVGILTRVLG